MTSVLGFVILLVIIFLIFWVPAEILGKAGFSRWLALLIPFTGFIGLIVFAFIEWPIHRELSWLRLKSGGSTGDDIALVERYAVDLENRGEWKKAAEVFEELARKAPTGEGSDYYKGCLGRLHERAGTTELA